MKGRIMPADAPAKKRRASGPRTQRPIFAVVRYKDEDGSSVQLEQSRLSIQIERDSGKLVEMLTGGGDFTGAAVVKVQLPAPTPRAKPAEGAPA